MILKVAFFVSPSKPDKSNLTNAGPMLARRLPRLPNIGPTLGRCVVCWARRSSTGQFEQGIMWCPKYTITNLWNELELNRIIISLYAHI